MEAFSSAPCGRPDKLILTKKIGLTSTGSVLVKMTRAQFEALTNVLTPMTAFEAGLDESSLVAAQPLPAMAVRRRLDSVRSCLRKIRPTGRPKLVRTVRLVCQPAGDITNIQIDHMLQLLEKEEFLKMVPGDTVSDP
jgi:hypothetical protein